MTPLLVLVAGPWRSGTDGDPARIAANLRRLEQAALAVYRRGHVPMIGEWLSLPLAAAAGATASGDAISESFLYPAAHRLLRRCDAVLRIEGASRGADADVTLARQLGKPVYSSVEAIPVVQESSQA
ncbi:hypothetical protein [Burkholderia vietnamiensis]|jgi:hypothetical protein|uniref:hypothetical protein n=1 Tax=Burkholderia vietnamiensis TaxID=60552 RepID=UPI000751E54F|nr:hypothetical protein [Burkholderia vietnamiensis]KVE14085.1 NUDIX hydrolase [Burkholderia vietnamiensis]KVE62767.1 NUDIX hydrolase [Burkholderia vietnamiensis]KVG10664.1 NUDIX hydrolase [Burkholderia vietnamiensis]MBR8356745.1 DUF4406 domain-containing protein [Burkholderia vietnamiensis]HDR8964359.1 DUF4406 domain-containing protein [Burkholderia vietnamiensis]